MNHNLKNKNKKVRVPLEKSQNGNKI